MLGTFLRLFIESEWKLTLVIFHKACFKTNLVEIAVPPVTLYSFLVQNNRLTELFIQTREVVISFRFGSRYMYGVVLLLFYIFKCWVCSLNFSLFLVDWRCRSIYKAGTRGHWLNLWRRMNRSICYSEVLWLWIRSFDQPHFVVLTLHILNGLDTNAFLKGYCL